jgi:hypothetical protein
MTTKHNGDNMITFSEVLTRLIKSSKQTPDEIASQADVSIHTLRAWIAGIYYPQRIYLMRLAKILYPNNQQAGLNILENTITIEQTKAK